MRARAFFYVCAGLFLLALSYHLGARNAEAQFGSTISGVLYNPSGAWDDVWGGFMVWTPSGDIYYRYMHANGGKGPLVSVGNFWSGATPAQQESWGALKSRYRGERGAAQPQDK